MEYEIACGCGKSIPVTEAMAGSSQNCECGQTVVVPPLSTLRATEVADATDRPAAALSAQDRPTPVVKPVGEIIAPTKISLREDGGAERGRRTVVMAALTPDALWIQDTARLRLIALQELEIAQPVNGAELAISPAPPGGGEKLTLTFDDATQAKRWYDRIQACQSRLSPAAPSDGRRVPEVVALVRRAPDVGYVGLGRVTFLHGSAQTADQGAQLRAGILGADAVIDLRRKRCPEIGSAARQVTGLAVRVDDEDGRKRLRGKWYAEEVAALTTRMLLLVGSIALLQFLVYGLLTGKSKFIVATGESLEESVLSAGLGTLVIYAWPLVAVALLRVLRWRELLRVAGFAVLIATTIRGLTALSAYLIAAVNSGVAIEKRGLGVLLDPFEWAFIIIGAVLCARAWRLAGRANQILPDEARVASMPRKVWSRGLLATTGIYALLCFGFVALSGYEIGAYMNQPGIDPRREHQALLALNQGVAHSDKKDFAAAEKSFQQSLRIWEDLASKPGAPSAYRANLAVTLSNLGWLRMRHSRDAEAEKYYSRVVRLADQLERDPDLDDDTKKTIAEARAVLAELRGEKSLKLLVEKENAAIRTYEEAQASDEPSKAEGLVRQAIAAWETLLPQSENPSYAKTATSRLATAYLWLAELQEQLDKRSDSEVSLKKAIDYGERAVSMDPARPLPKHNLQLARRMLEGLRSQAFHQEVDKFLRNERFREAIDFLKRSIKELEDRVNSGKDLETALPALAYRLNRLAWLLAHCPDEHVRDTKASVNYARQAVNARGDVAEFWHTLAIVQYRNGDWRDSLSSLEECKAKQGEFDASDWLLSAMNLFRLNRLKEAESAFLKSDQWMREAGRRAERDATSRLEYESMRPSVERLRREAQALIDGQPAVG
jgi:tetratricopeptide (TPR) repeat protein